MSGRYKNNTVWNFRPLTFFNMADISRRQFRMHVEYDSGLIFDKSASLWIEV